MVGFGEKFCEFRFEDQTGILHPALETHLERVRAKGRAADAVGLEQVPEELSPGVGAEKLSVCLAPSPAILSLVAALEFELVVHMPWLLVQSDHTGRSGEMQAPYDTPRV